MPDRHYWLVKSEPNAFSFDDLLASPKRTTCWDGVRNYAARNHMRAMKTGDQVLFYHSMASPSAIVGVAEVAREAYPDPTAFDAKDSHYDPKSKRDDPTWYMVDVRAVRKLAHPVTLADVKKTKGLEQMVLLRISQLSVQPVTEREFEIVARLGASEPKK